MPEFVPSSVHRATATFSNPKTAGFDFDASLCMGVEWTEMATASFHLDAGQSKAVQFPVTMPSALGTYPVYFKVYSGGVLIGTFAATEDVVIAVPVPRVEILRPNAAGTYTQWDFWDGTYHYEAVDEVSPDDTTTTIRTVNGNQIKIAIRTHSSLYYGSLFRPSSFPTFTTYSKQWTTNPNTGSAWTWDEIDALEAGVETSGGETDTFALPAHTGSGTINHVTVYARCSYRSATSKLYCTQVYVEVNYTPGVVVEPPVEPPVISIGVSRAYLREDSPSVSEAYSGWVSCGVGNELNLGLFGSCIQAGALIVNRSNVPVILDFEAWNHHWTPEGYIDVPLALPQYQPQRFPPAPTGLPYSSYEYEADKFCPPGTTLAPGETGFVYTTLYSQGRRWNYINLKIYANGQDMGTVRLYSGWYSY